jgi:hypothetical protein
MSLIETPSLQELGQRYGSYEAQKRPGQSYVQIEILSGSQAMQSAKADYDYAQYVDSHRSIGGARATAYPVQTQEAAQKEANIKHHYHSYLSIQKSSSRTIRIFRQ